jgi:hypothetical protein
VNAGLDQRRPVLVEILTLRAVQPLRLAAHGGRPADEAHGHQGTGAAGSATQENAARGGAREPGNAARPSPPHPSLLSRPHVQGARSLEVLSDQFREELFDGDIPFKRADA